MKIIENRQKRRRELVVPHEGKEIRFAYHNGGDNYDLLELTNLDWGLTYKECTRRIDSMGLIRPTSAQTASLINELAKAENGPMKYIFSSTKSIFEFTENFYTKKDCGKYSNGIFLYDNLQDAPLSANIKTLIKKLESGDNSVRFVKRDVDHLEFMHPNGRKIARTKLVQDDYMLARYGREGAEKIASSLDSDPAIVLLDSKSIHREKGDEFWYPGYSLARPSSLEYGTWGFNPQGTDYADFDTDTIPSRLGIKGTGAEFVGKGIAFGIIPEEKWAK